MVKNRNFFGIQLVFLLESLQEYGENREKMKKSEIEMDNIYETVQDLDNKAQVNFKFKKENFVKTCKKSILFLRKNLAETEIKKNKSVKIERQYRKLVLPEKSSFSKIDRKKHLILPDLG